MRLKEKSTTKKYIAPYLYNESFVKAPLFGYNPLGMD